MSLFNTIASYTTSSVNNIYIEYQICWAPPLSHIAITAWAEKSCAGWPALLQPPHATRRHAAMLCYAAKPFRRLFTLAMRSMPDSLRWLAGFRAIRRQRFQPGCLYCAGYTSHMPLGFRFLANHCFLLSFHYLYHFICFIASTYITTSRFSLIDVSVSVRLFGFHADCVIRFHFFRFHGFS